MHHEKIRIIDFPAQKYCLIWDAPCIFTQTFCLKPLYKTHFIKDFFSNNNNNNNNKIFIESWLHNYIH